MSHATPSIGRWIEYFNQRDVIELMKKDPHIEKSMLDRESKKLREMHEKALKK